MKFPVFSLLNREFGFRDEFARDCLLQQRVSNELRATPRLPEMEIVPGCPSSAPSALALLAVGLRVLILRAIGRRRWSG